MLELDLMVQPTNVKDQSNGNVLVGANVFIEGTSIGTAADQKGFYEITNIKEGNYSLKASYIGYKTYSDSISLQGDEKRAISKISNVCFCIFPGPGHVLYKKCVFLMENRVSGLLDAKPCRILWKLNQKVISRPEMYQM